MWFFKRTRKNIEENKVKGKNIYRKGKSKAKGKNGKKSA
jgi:hypothetical protein